ncbi:Uma2 family endonuclease [Haloactinopolyspora sp.]|uniref:Uma2 family endonuclease n=1 Tax=Haloactinopolyspora sp. TaxID=1966353 RepID=UPI0026319BC1|nr:Uma2 family endonuclease [Haloactinopolyspora sp.]
MDGVAAAERPLDSVEPWTFEDLRSLPESLWRYEIVDGALLMTPPAGIWHEGVSDALRATLHSWLPTTLRVVGPVGVDLHPTYLIPDLVVIDGDAVRPGRDRAEPSELSLVVEVVSPGSQSTDRILKPAKYAAAGIPHFWRIETRPHTTLTAYRLPGGASTYTELGTWKVGDVARFTEPFAIEVPIADLENAHQPG